MKRFYHAIKLGCWWVCNNKNKILTVLPALPSIKHYTAIIPTAHPSSGTLDTVPNIDKQQLIDFKDRYLVAANASIAITGNLTLTQAKTLAEDITSKLPAGQSVAELPEPQPFTQAQHIHIPFPSTQTTVLMGQLGN